jgi:hypothetical protein
VAAISTLETMSTLVSAIVPIGIVLIGIALAGVGGAAVGQATGTTTALTRAMVGTTAAGTITGGAVGMRPSRGARWGGDWGRSPVVGVMGLAIPIRTMKWQRPFPTTTRNRWW